MNTKHTPGPWTIDEYNTIKDTNGETVRVDGVALSSRSTEESRANCRLVAAAPELLNALQMIIAACDTCGKDDDKSLIDEFTQDMEDKARAAIAKATGQK